MRGAEPKDNVYMMVRCGRWYHWHEDTPSFIHSSGLQANNDAHPDAWRSDLVYLAYRGILRRKRGLHVWCGTEYCGVIDGE